MSAFKSVLAAESAATAGAAEQIASASASHVAMKIGILGEWVYVFEWRHWSLK
jgi:hypothetical protein